MIIFWFVRIGKVVFKYIKIVQYCTFLDILYVERFIALLLCYVLIPVSFLIYLFNSKRKWNKYNEIEIAYKKEWYLIKDTCYDLEKNYKTTVIKRSDIT